MPVELRSMTTSPAPGRISKPLGRSQHQRRGSVSSTASRSSSISSIPSRPNSPFTRPSILPLTPDTSRPCSPLNSIRQSSHSSRRQNSSKTSFVAFVAPPSPSSISGEPMVVTSEPESLALAMEHEPPTVTWECATAVVSSQKVHTTYEKPTYSPGTRFDASGEPIEGTGHVLQYGKMLTKTVTMTVTTTIASTEVLHPGEDGYDASRKRQRLQQQQQRPAQHDTPMGNMDGQSNADHEAFHASHHNAARPVPPPNDN